MKKPNIIFIMTDQQRYDTFSCINKEIITPNLDNLIKDTVFYKNAYCSNPSCVPSRAAIMTGKMPCECHVPAYISCLPDYEKTFMKTLKENGYHTAVIGKQHFAESTIDKGFDYEDIIDGHSPFSPKENLGSYAKYLESEGLDSKDMYQKTLISGGVWKTDIKHHIDDYIGERGKLWLEDRFESKNDEPFFFTLSFPGPHHPYDLEGTKYSEMYNLDDMSVPESTYQDLDTKGPQYKNMGMYSKIYLKDYTEETFKRTKRAYYANMTLIDEKVGQFIDVLKKYDKYDDCMIVFTSDHGDFMGDYGLVEKLQCLQDSLMRVPLFVKPPVKNFEGVAIEDKVVNIDIASTCFEVSGIEVPKGVSNYSYNSYWDDTKEKRVRDFLFLEAGDIKGIICDDVKTVHYINRNYGEMYDLIKDPLERVNIWDDENYKDAKIKNYSLMVNSMHKATTDYDTPWNIGTPEI